MAAIFSGLWMLLILALFSGLVGVVAMPTLAALLIYAAAGSLRFGQIATIWRTGLTSQIAISATFLATLLLPVATAVGIGVILLDVYGSLHYAGARALRHRLPEFTGTEGPAVVLCMRGRSTLGATFFTVLAGYARQFDDVGGRLYVAGIDPALMAQAERTGSTPRGRADQALRGRTRHRPIQPRRPPRRAALG